MTGVAYLKLGDLEAALQACTAPFAGASAPPGGENHLWCLTLTYGDAGLIFLKMDKLLDPVRQEPRFQAIYAKLNFPR